MFFSPLYYEIIDESFWPSIFGGEVSEDEKVLFSFPARMAGMGNNMFFKIFL